MNTYLRQNLDYVISRFEAGNITGVVVRLELKISFDIFLGIGNVSGKYSVHLPIIEAVL
jgi:hypothetical protein